MSSVLNPVGIFFTGDALKFFKAVVLPSTKLLLICMDSVDVVLFYYARTFQCVGFANCFPLDVTHIIVAQLQGYSALSFNYRVQRL
jgi:hypothetical protein